MTEHPAELFEAAQAERHAKIAAGAFAYGNLGPRESNVLQGILRRAWELDAKAADARLYRVAMVGAECVKTGSRGNAGRRFKTEAGGESRSNAEQAQARRALVLKAMMAGSCTKAEALARMGRVAPKWFNTVHKTMVSRGMLEPCGKDGAFTIYRVAGVKQ